MIDALEVTRPAGTLAAAWWLYTGGAADEIRGLPALPRPDQAQVVLSFGIPFALVPLVVLTRRADIMGPLVNHRITTVTTGCIVAMIIVLNGYLLYTTFTG